MQELHYKEVSIDKLHAIRTYRKFKTDIDLEWRDIDKGKSPYSGKLMVMFACSNDISFYSSKSILFTKMNRRSSLNFLILLLKRHKVKVSKDGKSMRFSNGVEVFLSISKRLVKTVIDDLIESKSYFNLYQIQELLSKSKEEDDYRPKYRTLEEVTGLFYTNFTMNRNPTTL